MRLASGAPCLVVCVLCIDCVVCFHTCLCLSLCALCSNALALFDAETGERVVAVPWTPTLPSLKVGTPANPTTEKQKDGMLHALLMCGKWVLVCICACAFIYVNAYMIMLSFTVSAYVIAARSVLSQG